MAVETKIRLFKIASEINIGKDAIVEFLQSKGLKIENKPTATLTGEMVELIYDKFKREKKAAEKQREKLQKHRDIRRATGEKDIFEDIPTQKEELKKEVVTAAKQAAIEELQKEELQKELLKKESLKKEIAKKSELKEKEKLDEASKTTEIVIDKIEKTIIKTDKIETVDKDIKTVKVIKEKLKDVEEFKESKKEVEIKKDELTQKEAKPGKKIKEIETSVKEAETDIIKKEIIGEKTDESISKIKEPEILAIPEAELESEIEKLEDKSEIKQRKKKKKPKKVAEVEVDFKDEEPRLKGLKIVGKIDIKASKFKRAKKEPSKKLMEEFREDSDKLTTKLKQIKLKKKFKDKEAIELEEFDKGEDNRRRKRKKTIREQISQEEVERAIKRTLSGIDEQRGMAQRSRMRLKKRLEREEKELKYAEQKLKESSILRLSEFVTTSDLANLMNVSVNDVILKCIHLGLIVTLNQRLDKDTIILIADDYGYQVEFVEEDSFFFEDGEDDDETNLKPRSPIVTIMGHVDHGKTSLLDFIRHSNVVAGEAGGITQHIAAYRVELGNGKSITFLDTPGHEAFTAMRARGAQVTDLVVLVVAADDSVMPQTIEAINHAQAAKVPIIVAINKIDKPESRPDRIKQQLSEHKILVEEWGGKNQCVEISAKYGQNIDQLLEKILLEAELLDLKSNPDRNAVGTIIESHMSKGLGIVSTVIVQKGTLKIGDGFVAGVTSGRVRSMLDERGNKVDFAGPSIPVGVIGFDSLPEAGDKLIVFASEAEARAIASRRLQMKREQALKQKKPITLDEISKNIHLGGLKELQLIIKGDVMGSVEALSDSLSKLSNDEVGISIIHKGVGTVSESDVMLAVASGAVIIGFQVPVAVNARRIAEREMVDIRLYNIIYNCISEVQLALEGLLSPDIKEEITSKVEIRKLFKISKTGVIAGCYVLEGKINRNDRVRVLRDGMLIYNGSIHSLKRNKDDVKEVDQGFECGILLDGYSEIEVGDIIEGYKIVEVKRTLGQ